MQAQHSRNQTPLQGFNTGAGRIARVLDTLPNPKDSTVPVWNLVLDIPGVRSWKILRQVAFLVTSLPVALAAFLVMVTGFATGAALSWLLIGIPILIWTVGLTLRFSQIERDRLGTLLGEEISVPRYPQNHGENVLKHSWQVMRSRQVWSDIGYMALLLPVAIVELAVVWLPLEFALPSLMHLVFGSLSPFDIFAMDIGSRTEALLFLGVAGIMVMPTLILINIAARLHVSLARKMLGRK